MALIDDIIGIILIVISAIVVTSLLLLNTISDQKSTLQFNDERFLEDYYSTAISTFLQLDEPVLGKPYNVILGDYVYSGKRFQEGPEGIVDIKESSEDALNQILGAGNYYLKLEPKLSAVEFSFVFDGSNSMDDERIALAQNIRTFEETIRPFFDEETIITFTIYVLSNDAEVTVCAPYQGIPGVTCQKLNFEQLYSSNLVSKPTFGYATYNDWARRNHYAQPDWFWEGDWIAGTAYASERFLERMIAAQDTSRVHVIIPISDELSTGGTADSCYNISRSLTAAADYIPCEYCNSECPIERAGRDLDSVIESLQGINTFVLPVYSFSCNFRYNPANNNLVQTDYNTQFIDFPIEESLCSEPMCGACVAATPPTNYDEYCFHPHCEDAVLDHMEQLAQGTGGSVINIEDANDLTEEVLSRIEAIFEPVTLEIGILDNERTRFIFERELLLPNFGTTTLRFRAYQELYVDDDAPTLNNVKVTPTVGREGVQFVVSATADDFSGVSVQAEYDNPDGSLHTLSLHEQLGIFSATIDSTGFAETSHTILVRATDSYGNSIEAETSFTIDNTDVMPPTITARVPQSVSTVDGFINILADVTDDIGVESVVATITAPDGTVTTLPLIQINSTTWGATFEPVDQEGEYTIVIVATDGGGNTAQASGETTAFNSRFRVIYVPLKMDLTWSEAEANTVAQASANYLLERLPLQECSNPESRFDSVTIPSSLCEDISCPPSPAAGGVLANVETLCGTCQSKAIQCYNRWKAQTNDDGGYDLLVTLLGASQQHQSGVVGCVAGLGNPVSTSIYIPQARDVENHEVGHSMGLCHVGPSGGNCGSPSGVDAPGCPNRGETISQSCIMNYCQLPQDQKAFCPKAYNYIETQILADYMEGCQ